MEYKTSTSKMISASDSKDPIELEALVTPQLDAALINSPLRQLFRVFPGNIADTINKFGLQEAQRQIRIFYEHLRGEHIPIFICQHILGEELAFFGGRVYSPHASRKNRFQLIPHFNAITSDFVDYMPLKSRRWLGTFIGDTNTNPIRPQIVRLLSNDARWLVRDTGTWHFSKSPANQAANQSSYRASLAASVCVFSPPGTGAGTLRLWESMSFGCVPIIFGDTLIPQEIDELVIRIEHLDSIASIESAVALPNHELSRRSAYIYNIYWSKFANNKIVDFIISDLKRQQ